MSVLGAVTVITASIVKVASIIGVAATAIGLGFAGWEVMNPNLTPALASDPSGAKDVAMWGVGFLASIAGWHFADWLNGRAEVVSNKARQQAELERLQAGHGVAL